MNLAASGGVWCQSGWGLGQCSTGQLEGGVRAQGRPQDWKERRAPLQRHSQRKNPARPLGTKAAASRALLGVVSKGSTPEPRALKVTPGALLMPRARPRPRFLLFPKHLRCFQAGLRIGRS